MDSHDHDLLFLNHVYQVLDQDPRANVMGIDVADTIGISHDDAERAQARLLRDEYLTKRPAPQRVGDGPLRFRLEVTAKGAHAANRQQLD